MNTGLIYGRRVVGNVHTVSAMAVLRWAVVLVAVAMAVLCWAVVLMAVRALGVQERPARLRCLRAHSRTAFGVCWGAQALLSSLCCTWAGGA